MHAATREQMDTKLASDAFQRAMKEDNERLLEQNKQYAAALERARWRANVEQRIVMEKKAHEEEEVSDYLRAQLRDAKEEIENVKKVRSKQTRCVRMLNGILISKLGCEGTKRGSQTTNSRSRDANAVREGEASHRERSCGRVPSSLAPMKHVQHSSPVKSASDPAIPSSLSS